MHARSHACMHARTLPHVHFRARSMKVIAVERDRPEITQTAAGETMQQKHDRSRTREYFCANEMRMRYVSNETSSCGRTRREVQTRI